MITVDETCFHHYDTEVKTSSNKLGNSEYPNMYQARNTKICKKSDGDLGGGGTLKVSYWKIIIYLVATQLIDSDMQISLPN